MARGHDGSESGLIRGVTGEAAAFSEAPDGLKKLRKQRTGDLSGRPDCRRSRARWLSFLSRLPSSSPEAATPFKLGQRIR